MTTSELVQYFVDRVQRGEITFDRIRPELNQRGIAENEIKVIVREVDEKLQNQLLSGQSSYAQLIVVGIVVVAIGLVLTIGVHTGIVTSIRSYVLLFGYIPIVAGVSMIFVALRRRKGRGARKFGSRMQDPEKINET
jgi:hypothetical protein